MTHCIQCAALRPSASGTLRHTYVNTHMSTHTQSYTHTHDSLVGHHKHPPLHCAVATSMSIPTGVHTADSHSLRQYPPTLPPHIFSCALVNFTCIKHGYMLMCMLKAICNALLHNDEQNASCNMSRTSSKAPISVSLLRIMCRQLLSSASPTFLLLLLLP